MQRDKTYAVGSDVGQHGRFNVAELTARAAREDLGALGDGVLDVLDDLVGLAAVDQGPVGAAASVLISTKLQL